MYTMYEVYLKFRQAQSRFFSRPYRLPKNFEEFLDKKLSKTNRNALEAATKFFNTKWKNIDIDRYFQYGFELYGTKFTYVKFFDRILMNSYIAKDKHLKRDIEIGKENLIESANFVKRFMKDKVRNKKISLILQYSNLKEGKESVPIQHYIHGKIDKYFLVWLISKKYLVLDDSDKSMIPLIVDNYREYVGELSRFNPKYWGVRE